jgi:hypothetical protein
MSGIPPKQITKPETFIIESLSMENEKNNVMDGKMLYDVLKLYGKNPLYYYCRTTRELRKFADEYRNSGYRYLHLSCHGSNEGISLTLDNLTFDDFAEIFEGKLDNRRLFISGCELGNQKLADSVFLRNGGIYSIIAPTKPIFFQQSVPFWSAFHYRMNAYSEAQMKKAQIEESLENLSSLFEMEMIYFRKNHQNNVINASFPKPIAEEKANIQPKTPPPKKPKNPKKQKNKRASESNNRKRTKSVATARVFHDA